VTVPDGSLNGRVAIVTGASRGIGRQLALALADHGASVVVAARSVEERRTLPGTVGETVSQIVEAGGTALAVRCDVSQPADLEAMVATAVEAFGRLDLVVNNAADMVGQDLEPMVEAMFGTSQPAAPSAADLYERWAQQFATNVHAPWYLSMLAAPHMRAGGGGVIVNVTSGAARAVPVAEVLAMSAEERTRRNRSVGYAASKAALDRLTNAIAADLAGDGIAVIAVDPGATRTELADLIAARSRLDPSGMAPMARTVDAVLGIVTAEDPMALTGTVIGA